MDEWWETDAHDVTIDKVCRANLKQKITGSWRMRALTVKAILLNLQAKSRSEASVEAHYDIGNDLYTRMLDERMVYICGTGRTRRRLPRRTKPSARRCERPPAAPTGQRGCPAVASTSRIVHHRRTRKS